jgi:hypothetical protein
MAMTAPAKTTKLDMINNVSVCGISKTATPRLVGFTTALCIEWNRRRSPSSRSPQRHC